MQSMDACLWEALSKVERVESASGKKNSSQALSPVSYRALGMQETDPLMVTPGEKHVMGWNLKGRNAGGCGVLKKIS